MGGGRGVGGREAGGKEAGGKAAGRGGRDREDYKEMDEECGMSLAYVYMLCWLLPQTNAS